MSNNSPESRPTRCPGYGVDCSPGFGHICTSYFILPLGQISLAREIPSRQEGPCVPSAPVNLRRILHLIAMSTSEQSSKDRKYTRPETRDCLGVATFPVVCSVSLTYPGATSCNAISPRMNGRLFTEVSLAPTVTAQALEVHRTGTRREADWLLDSRAVLW